LKRKIESRVGMIKETLVEMDVMESPNSAVVLPMRKNEKINNAPSKIEKGNQEMSRFDGLLVNSLK